MDQSSLRADALPVPGELGASLRSYVASSLRYWEPRRLIYNAALASVVIAHFAGAWPATRALLTFDLALGVFFLAVMANIVYCAAYFVDIFVQFSGLQEALRWGRPALLAVGTGFAAAITHFFVKNIVQVDMTLARGFTQLF